ncbi:hypothetical protein PRIPAC_81943 [Pristionchus pacificus]|uniref:G protein-coupled receptor n=1 Tax=Pristionchus pacificus TaxID=54126 RepID=A0A2A6CQ82_PRIPA|nr:hypothetical protein PRIPAC_81943 [Pristionchus pacificus]|eukprot:PDM80375.1 G protein-coupled receptor [Pristionchus pacificus]
MAIPIIVHKVILYSSAVVSVFGNGLLLLLLAHRNSHVLGKYRVLLAMFALTDIAISLFDAWFIPIFLLGEYGYVFFGYGSLFLEQTLGKIVNVTYCSSFFVPFILLPRFLQQHFGIFIFISFIYSTAYVAAIAYIAYTICGQKATDQFSYVMMDYANMSAIPAPNAFPVEYIDEIGSLRTVIVIGVFTSGVLCGKSIIVCGVCIVKILHSFKTRVLEIRTRHLQIQLFRALIIQFIIPVIFYFVPFCIIVGAPLAGVSFGQLGNVCSITSSVFPAIDPLLIIVSISRFRHTVLDWFYRATGRKAQRNEKKTKEMSRIHTSMVAQKRTATLD